MHDCIYVGPHFGAILWANCPSPTDDTCILVVWTVCQTFILIQTLPSILEALLNLSQVI